MKNYFTGLGLKPAQHIMVHSSFRRIKERFPDASPQDIIRSLKEIITPDGSVIFPSFTYCFKRSAGDYEIFDRNTSPSKVGVMSEQFRNSEGVIRTSSPTHSFSLWGKAARLIDYRNSPSSPLGHGSVIDWLAKTENSFVLLVGVTFSSLTLGHYIEIASSLNYLSISPWKYLNVLEAGVSGRNIPGQGTTVLYEQELKEVPGCARSFVKFEQYLLRENLISRLIEGGPGSYLIAVKPLIHYGKDYLLTYPKGFLCERGTCPSCDERHEYDEKIRTGERQ